MTHPTPVKPETSGDACPRCNREYAYGCSCTIYELSEWQAEEIFRLKSALLKIDQLEAKSHSMREADENFKECGNIARQALEKQS
ncbi:hypothetical protein JY97_00450 [Alkalispirochaeta odontotermitis]|nr:hypothetical protein JY97_00450 [Alkalispirochaeta odontotermitis]